MAKLILSQNGEVTGNFFIDKTRFTIGSQADNDLCLTVQGISRNHAVINSVGNDDILEDLQSTNGTLVNGQRITRHILQNDDVIEIAGCQIRYRNQKATGGATFDRTMVMQAPGGITQPHTQPPNQSPAHTAAVVTAKQGRNVSEGFRLALVRGIKGQLSGKEIELPRVLQTFGSPGTQLAVINRRPHGYFITHVEGKIPALVNGKSIGAESRLLAANDIIDVGGEKLLFLFR